MIKSYTLDCGCYFEHRQRDGHTASYEVVSACGAHDKLSSTPPLTELPPVPFLMRRQAGGIDPDRHTVCEPTMPSGARMSVQAGIGLPMQQTNSKFEALVEQRVDEAMDDLERTQPIDPFTPEVLAKIERDALEDTQPALIPYTWPHVLARIEKIEKEIADLHLRVSPFPYQEG